MVFVSRTRPAAHRTTHSSSSHRHRTAQVEGTKRGEQCHHRFRCWFGLHCRGLHTEPEVAHFHKCDLEACQQLSLQQPASHQLPDTQQRSSAFTNASANQPATNLAPQSRRRKHRRLRKKQRARQRKVDRVSCRSFRKERRHLSTRGPTQDANISATEVAYLRMVRNRTADVNVSATEMAAVLSERQQLRTELSNASLRDQIDISFGVANKLQLLCSANSKDRICVWCKKGHS